MHTDTITGLYGGTTPETANKGTIFIAANRYGFWYAVEGSQNVNFTPENVTEGTWIEELQDTNTMTIPEGIHSEEDLIAAIEA